MNELAKWAWIILLMVLFMGPYMWIVLGVYLLAYALILWLKPKWIDKF